MRTFGNAIVGIIPDLESLHLRPPLTHIAHRAQGQVRHGSFAVLETEEQVLAYASHPAHLMSVLAMRLYHVGNSR
ncbi:hypothetical protein LIA77_02090 [Sarocladium implicatum]|nr:hypothetical protein LIA77_02090 [Sarocladium implicatum]